MKGARQLRRQQQRLGGGAPATGSSRSGRGGVNQLPHMSGGRGVSTSLTGRVVATTLTGRIVPAAGSSTRGAPDFATRLRQLRLVMAGRWANHRSDWPSTIAKQYSSLSENVGCKPNKIILAALKAMYSKRTSKFNEVFNASGSFCGHQPFAVLLEVVEQYFDQPVVPHLTQLLLRLNALGVTSAPQLVRLVGSPWCCALVKLDLAHNGLAAGAPSVLRAVAQLKQIRTITLRDNCLDDDMAEDVADVIRSCGKLRSLDLSENLFRKAGHVLINTLRSPDAKLRALILRDNFLGDSVGNQACTMLKVNTALLNLDLSGNVMLQRTIYRIQRLLSDRKLAAQRRQQPHPEAGQPLGDDVPAQRSRSHTNEEAPTPTAYSTTQKTQQRPVRAGVQRGLHDRAPSPRQLLQQQRQPSQRPSTTPHSGGGGAGGGDGGTTGTPATNGTGQFAKHLSGLRAVAMAEKQKLDELTGGTAAAARAPGVRRATGALEAIARAEQQQVVERRQHPGHQQQHGAVRHHHNAADDSTTDMQQRREHLLDELVDQRRTWKPTVGFGNRRRKGGGERHAGKQRVGGTARGPCSVEPSCVISGDDDDHDDSAHASDGGGGHARGSSSGSRDWGRGAGVRRTMSETASRLHAHVAASRTRPAPARPAARGAHASGGVMPEEAGRGDDSNVAASWLDPPTPAPRVVMSKAEQRRSIERLSQSRGLARAGPQDPHGKQQQQQQHLHQQQQQQEKKDEDEKVGAKRTPKPPWGRAEPKKPAPRGGGGATPKTGRVPLALRGTAAATAAAAAAGAASGTSGPGGALSPSLVRGFVPGLTPFQRGFRVLSESPANVNGLFYLRSEIYALNRVLRAWGSRMLSAFEASMPPQDGAGDGASWVGEGDGGAGREGQGQRHRNGATASAADSSSEDDGRNGAGSARPRARSGGGGAGGGADSGSDPGTSSIGTVACAVVSASESDAPAAVTAAVSIGATKTGTSVADGGMLSVGPPAL